MLQQFNFEAFSVMPLVVKDAPSLYALMDRNAARFQLFFPKTLAANLSEEGSITFIHKATENIKNKKIFLFAIKANKEVAGLVYIKELDWNTKEGEFAICIGKQYTGKGWMSQTVTTLSNYAFRELGLQTLNFIVHESNKKSIAVADRCGFSFMKMLEKEYTPPGGQPMDMRLYQLKKKDE